MKAFAIILLVAFIGFQYGEAMHFQQMVEDVKHRVNEVREDVHDLLERLEENKEHCKAQLVHLLRRAYELSFDASIATLKCAKLLISPEPCLQNTVDQLKSYCNELRQEVKNLGNCARRPETTPVPTPEPTPEEEPELESF